MLTENVISDCAQLALWNEVAKLDETIRELLAELEAKAARIVELSK